MNNSVFRRKAKMKKKIKKSANIFGINSKYRYICRPKLPDRLRAGLQFLVLTVLVRIQLGQLSKAY